MQCQRSGSTLKRRDTGRQLRWAVEPHLHKIKAKKNSSKNCATGAHRTDTNESAPGATPRPGIHNNIVQTKATRETSHCQAFTTNEKTLQRPGRQATARHAEHIQKHYNRNTKTSGDRPRKLLPSHFLRKPHTTLRRNKSGNAGNITVMSGCCCGVPS